MDDIKFRYVHSFNGLGFRFGIAKLATDESSALNATATGAGLGCLGLGGCRIPIRGLLASISAFFVGMGFVFELCGRTLSLRDINLRTASGDSAPVKSNIRKIYMNLSKKINCHEFMLCNLMWFKFAQISTRALGRDRIVVSTSRCGRDNPGSNPGHGSDRCGVAIMARSQYFFFTFFIFLLFCDLFVQLDTC